MDRSTCKFDREVFYLARSQGGVKLPTGGIRRDPGARERFRFRKVSRSGVMPEPTVTVRMEEDNVCAHPARGRGGLVRPRDDPATLPATLERL